MVDKELIENWRNMLKPAISSRLLKTNYEGMGEQDKEEFERDFDEFLDLALTGLKYKAQLLQERTKSHAETHACDLIDREAAVDAIYHHLPSVSRTRARTMLHEVPSAQPETSMLTVKVAPDPEEIEKIVCKIKNTPVMVLPSAQPERTCVNCGRTVNNGGWYADGGTRCPIEEHYALPKDGYCHLWEKRNVTDDDYPERREE